MTGTEFPAAFRPYLSSIPDPSSRLMSKTTQQASSKSTWFLNAFAEENSTVSYPFVRSSRFTLISIPRSSSTTKTTFGFGKSDVLGLSANAAFAMDKKQFENTLSPRKADRLRHTCADRLHPTNRLLSHRPITTRKRWRIG